MSRKTVFENNQTILFLSSPKNPCLRGYRLHWNICNDTFYKMKFIRKQYYITSRNS